MQINPEKTIVTLPSNEHQKFFTPGAPRYVESLVGQMLDAELRRGIVSVVNGETGKPVIFVYAPGPLGKIFPDLERNRSIDKGDAAQKRDLTPYIGGAAPLAFMAGGDEHKKIRRIVSPPLQPTAVMRYIPQFAKENAVIAAELTERISKEPGSFDLRPALQTIAQHSIFHLVSAHDQTPDEQQGLVSSAFDKWMGYVGAVRMNASQEVQTAAEIAGKQEIEKMNTVLYGILDAAEQENTAVSEDQVDRAKKVLHLVIHGDLDTPDLNIFAEDLLQVYHILLKAESNPAKQMELRNAFRDIITILFIAGMESMTNGLASTIYEVAHNPAIAAKLYTEIKEVLGNQELTFALLEKMPYLDHCVKEALRRRNPFTNIRREIMEDFEIDGVQGKKGGDLVVSLASLLKDETVYKDAEMYNPDRWDNPTPEMEENYIPFGVGSRICPAFDFAEKWIKANTAELFRNFEIQVQRGWELPNETKGLTLNRLDALLMSLEKR